MGDILRVMNWQEFDDETRKLAKKIDAAPDMIVGIARGGIIPATLLAKILKVKDMQTLNMQREGTGRHITATIFGDVSGKHVLLVEDMIETGESLIAGKRFLEERGAVVETCCLFIMPTSRLKPDYFLREIDTIAEFPWNR